MDELLTDKALKLYNEGAPLSGVARMLREHNVDFTPSNVRRRLMDRRGEILQAGVEKSLEVISSHSQQEESIYTETVKLILEETMQKAFGERK